MTLVSYETKVLIILPPTLKALIITTTGLPEKSSTVKEARTNVKKSSNVLKLNLFQRKLLVLTLNIYLTPASLYGRWQSPRTWYQCRLHALTDVHMEVQYPRKEDGASLEEELICMK